MIEYNIIEDSLALNFTLFVILRECPFILPEKFMKVIEKQPFKQKIRVTLGQFLFKITKIKVSFSRENDILYVQKSMIHSP